jgi:prolyl-tRNA editing enzyme YbaK/EbsC (Cys-tRNA(Pro) deacylase)
VLSAQASATARVVAAAQAGGVEIKVVSLEQSTRTAQEAASAVGAEVGQIVKSLVFVADDGDGTPSRTYLALISGSNLADVAALAQAVGEPAVRRSTADEARAATSYAIGGIPPFGHHSALRVLMDPDLLSYDVVWAAAGTGNSVFAIKPADLQRLSGAQVAAISRPASEIAPR